MPGLLFFSPEDKGLQGRPFRLLLPVLAIGFVSCFAFFAYQIEILEWWAAAIFGGALALLLFGFFYTITVFRRLNPEVSGETFKGEQPEPAGGSGTEGQTAELQE